MGDEMASTRLVSLSSCQSVEDNAMSTITDIPNLHGIEYPQSDGKPLGESDAHRCEIEQEVECLRAELARLRGEQ
jgi:hypothetical protein